MSVQPSKEALREYQQKQSTKGFSQDSQSSGASDATWEKAQAKAKANDEDENQERDWAKTLEATVLCGEAISKIVLPPRQIIIPDWFHEGECGFIFATRGLAKTWMSLGLGIAICTKGKFGPYASEVEWPVLYVDGEMPFEVIRQRITALRDSIPRKANDEDENQALHNSIPKNLHFLSHEILFQQEQATLNLTDISPQQAITDFCLAKGIRVVILDNLSCLFSGLRENDADSWEIPKLWLLTLRRHRIATIVVHHTGRNPNYMRGTTRREDDVFWIMRLEEPADAKVTRSPGARFITRFTKNRGAPTEPLSYDWTIQPEGDKKVRVAFKETSSDDVIVSWVRDGVTSASDIAAEMGVTKGTIAKRVARLVEGGRLAKKGRDYILGSVEQADWRETRDWSK
jgi:putative DNA primase/helicase